MCGEHEQFDTLTLGQWETAAAPGGRYFDRISRLYVDGRVLEDRFSSTAPTCDCHKPKGKEKVPHTHTSAFIARMSEHLDEASSNGTLTIDAPPDSPVLMHAFWGSVKDSQWTTFDRWQDRDDNEAGAGADTTLTDLHGTPVYTQVQ